MKGRLTVLKDTAGTDRKAQQQVLEVCGHTASSQNAETDGCLCSVSEDPSPQGGITCLEGESFPLNKADLDNFSPTNKLTIKINCHTIILPAKNSAGRPHCSIALGHAT